MDLGRVEGIEELLRITLDAITPVPDIHMIHPPASQYHLDLDLGVPTLAAFDRVLEDVLQDAAQPVGVEEDVGLLLACGDDPYGIAEERDKMLDQGHEVYLLGLALRVAEEVRDAVGEVDKALRLALDQGDLVQVLAVAQLALEEGCLYRDRTQRILDLMRQGARGLPQVHEVALAHHLLLVLAVLDVDAQDEDVEETDAEHSEEGAEVDDVAPGYVCGAVEGEVHDRRVVAYEVAGEEAHRHRADIADGQRFAEEADVDHGAAVAVIAHDGVAARVSSRAGDRGDGKHVVDLAPAAHEAAGGVVEPDAQDGLVAHDHLAVGAVLLYVEDELVELALDIVLELQAVRAQEDHCQYDDEDCEGQEGEGQRDIDEDGLTVLL